MNSRFWTKLLKAATKILILENGHMVNCPPYVDAYGKTEELFRTIIEAQVPPKVTVDFIYTKLGLKSTSYRAVIPLLKKLGFIDDASAPNAYYRGRANCPIIL